MLSTKRMLAGVMAFAMAFAVGCDLTNPKGANPAPERRSAQQKATPGKVLYRRNSVRAPQSARGMSMSRYRTVAAKVRRATLATDEVDKAAVVVVPGTSTALCGVELADDVKGAETRAALSEVKRDVQALPEISKCYVTADPNLVSRLRGIASGIADGKPISAFTKEISQVMSRIVPK